MIYAWRYPQSIHRSVMIGVNPPGNFLWNAKTTGEQIARYAAAVRAGAGLPQPHPRPRRLNPLRLRQDPEPFLVPADQERQRARRGLLRPHQRHRRRWRPARSPQNDRHAALAGQGQRGRRGLAALSLRRNRAPARAGLGRHRRRRPHRRHLRQAAVRERRRPGLRHRQPRHRVPHGGRPTIRRLARESRREGIQQRSQLERRDAADQRPARLRHTATERHASAPAPPPERASGRPAETRPRRRLLGLPARRWSPG